MAIGIAIRFPVDLHKARGLTEQPDDVGVCTENLNPNVVMMKSVQDGM